MPNKQAILENVDMYSADELVSFIKAGIVTFDELCDETEGYFSASVRKEVEKKLAGSEEEDWQEAKSSNSKDLLERYLSAYTCGAHRSEAKRLLEILENRISQKQAESVWESVDKNIIDELKNFCETYPDDAHCKEAKRRINQLTRETYIVYDIESLKEQIKTIETSKELNKNKLIYERVVGYLNNHKITHDDFLTLIETDHNIFGAETLNSFIDDGLLTFDELRDLDIDSRFIRCLAKKKRPQDFNSLIENLKGLISFLLRFTFGEYLLQERAAL